MMIRCLGRWCVRQNRRRGPLAFPAFLLPLATQIRDKIPAGWRERAATRGVGWVFADPATASDTQSSVRIDDADPRPNAFPAQAVPHVKVIACGRVLDREGNVIGSSSSQEAHIPLDIWLTWRQWDER